MNIVEEVEKWAEGLWDAIREHVAPDAEAAAKAVLDQGKAQVADLAQQAAQDAKDDLQKAAQGAQTVAGDASTGIQSAVAAQQAHNDALAAGTVPGATVPEQPAPTA